MAKPREPLPSGKQNTKSLDTIIRELEDRQKIKERVRSRSQRSSRSGNADILISISSLIQQDMEELADAIGPDASRGKPVSPEKYLKAAEDVIKNWTRSIDGDKSIPPLVK